MQKSIPPKQDKGLTNSIFYFKNKKFEQEIIDSFISDENELCNYKKFENGIVVNVTGDLFQFVITVLFPYNIYAKHANRKYVSGHNDHEVEVIVKDPKLVNPVIEYLTTTEGVGPNP